MFHEDSFSLDSFSTDSWLFLLEVPYFDLTRKQRVHVRYVLQSVYALDVVERIVSVAERKNLSVLDSAIALRVSTEPLRLVIEAAAVKKRVGKKLPPIREPKARAIPATRPAYAVSTATVIRAEQDSISVVSWHEADSVIAFDSADQLFIRTGRN